MVLIDVFFRLVNFIGLLLLASYFFYTKVLPLIKGKIGARILFRQQLRQEVDHVIAGQQKVIDKQKADEITCSDLKKKVDLWQNSWVQERENYRSEQERNHQLLLERRQIQSNNYKVRKVGEIIQPEVIASLQAELQKKFDNNVAQNKYNEDIISFFKKKL